MIPARYYDGRTARGHDVRVRAERDQLLIDTAEGMPLATWPFEQLERAGAWGRQGPFALSCRGAPDARLLLPDRRSAAELSTAVPQLEASERLGRRRGIRLGVMGAVAAALLVALVYEVLPRMLASAIPSGWLAPLGDSLVAQLQEEHRLCADGPGRRSLERMANRLAARAGHAAPIRIEMLNRRELNAFALPGDRILILQGLIERADPDELAGVLAHEVGHVVNHHVNEAVVRALGVQVLLTFFTGTGDFATAAAVLASLGYSRAAEAEADRFAVEAMRSEGLRISGLRRFFERLAVDGESHIIPSWLSTHPRSSDRAAAIPADPAGVEAFTPGEWEAIRSACR